MRTPSVHGCADSKVVRSVAQENNFASLYELDLADYDELVTTLYFPSTSVQLTGCTYRECPEKITDWVDDSRSTRPQTKVSAELRTKVSASYAGGCLP